MMINSTLEHSPTDHILILSVPSVFSLPAVVKSHGWAQMAPFEVLPEDGLAYVIRLGGGKVIRFTVQQAAEGLQVEASDRLSAAEQAEVGEKVTWMLGLEQDFSEFYALAMDEPKLRRMVERRAGRVLRSPALFEDVIRTLLTTNTLWRHTLKMCRELVRLYGDAGRDTMRAFPTPARLAQVGEAALREQVRMGYRAPYVASLAQAVEAGAIDLEAYKTSSLPTPELRQELMRIKGVGGYAAANLLMILGRYDYVPVDSWALKVVSAEFFGGEPVTPKQVLTTFERWGCWQGLAYWFWEWKFD
jgi:3-methyladenine DNA glycosylase/8-oxoguanine DNA glycosylase